MLRILWVYVNGSGTVIATSAENGSELLRAEAEGVWGPVFGVERLGPIVYNAFVPGTPLYKQVTNSKKADEAAFRESVRRYREMPVKPSLPEEARKFKIQAESAFNRKDFDEAAARYLDALKVAPWWPEGYFNRALILGETGRYRKAIEEMRKYLLIVPDAQDARAAQDKIYEWEGLARKAGSQSVEFGAPDGTVREPSRIR
jgi:tetratricopeptide (TPR) repeat protein